MAEFFLASWLANSCWQARCFFYSDSYRNKKRKIKMNAQDLVVNLQ